MNTSLNRRLFLHSILMAAAGGSASLAARATPVEKERAEMETAEPSQIPIIDTHQHLWDLSKFRLPWHKKASTLAKTFLMADYLKATEGLHVVKERPPIRGVTQFLGIEGKDVPIQSSEDRTQLLRRHFRDGRRGLLGHRWSGCRIRIIRLGKRLMNRTARLYFDARLWRKRVGLLSQGNSRQ